MTNHHDNRSLRQIRPLRSLLTACAATLLALSATAQERDYVQYVNTLQGTDSHFGLSYGNTFATTAMPYAMHTWSAQTGPNGEGWKYQYFVDRIRGFQQAHQCSPWMSDYAVYSLMPEVGELVLDEDTRGAKFSHANEVAKPHYYKVTFDNGITTEMAPTTRGVHLRFSFPRKGGAAYLVLDGYTAQSEVKIDPERREISGWVNNYRFVNHPETFRSYFVIRFDRPFEEWGTWENRQNTRTDGQTEAAGDGCGAYIRFKAGTKVQAKAASSYISPEQAKGERTDARTDIYSVGVMLYEMLSGRLPFDGDGAVSIAIMQISEKPKPLAEIAPQTPAGLRQITEKAMEKDPDKRYQSAQEMLAAIEEFKRNPSIQFAYEYRSAEDNPERNINRVVSNTKPSPKSTSIHTGDARRVGTSNPGRSKSAQKKKKKASKGFSLLPIFFGMAVAFVIGAAILIYLIFTNSSNLLFSNRADVQVISFVGMTKDEFLATDYNNLLRAEFPEEYSSEPAGTIIRQTPKAGRTVKEKQRIVLTVSLGTQYVTIPETKNMVAEDAEQTLKDMGLRVTKKPMSDNSVANGAVVYTQPAAGETVEGDSTVILYVSRSEVSKESQVPSLTGKTIEEARNEVKGLNLSIRTIEQASEQPAGTVLSQSPAAGSEARITSAITLVVSTGVPEVVETPTDNGGGDEDDNVIEESWWPSADGSHQIHQLTDGTMWNENGQRCDAQGNPIA